MLKLNNKGQASSTFQLLIAAVVALAILGVLLSILNVIPGPNADPSNATKTLLKTQVDSPGAEQCTTKVTFTRSVSRVATESITAETGLDPEQVYFDNPEGMTPPFELSENQQLLKYTSTTSKKVIMCIICSNSIEHLNSAISENAKSTDDFGNVPEVEDGQTLCVVYPRKTA
ncbi:MAG: hypothetical protein WCX82_00035 [archaeon]|jgi:hypothetical protein